MFPGWCRRSRRWNAVGSVGSSTVTSTAPTTDHIVNVSVRETVSPLDGAEGLADFRYAIETFCEAGPHHRRRWRRHAPSRHLRRSRGVDDASPAQEWATIAMDKEDRWVRVGRSQRIAARAGEREPVGGAAPAGAARRSRSSWEGTESRDWVGDGHRAVGRPSCGLGGRQRERHQAARRSGLPAWVLADVSASTDTRC